MRKSSFVAKQSPRRDKIILCVAMCVLTSVIIFALFFGFLLFFDAFPFSDKSISNYDLLAQIVPYAEHFFQVMKGNGSFFYSYHVGGGMDVFGTVMYCLCSPFIFLFYLFGEGNAYYAASIMLPLKLSCIAASAIMLIFFRFPKMSKALIVPVALSYAFSGYTFVANTYINWLDFLIYMPLAILAFDYMLKTGKSRYLALAIAACIYTCFSIVCFSMLISYPLFVAYGYIVVQKKERNAYLFKLSLAYLCGVLAALPVMVPSLMAYLRSGRNIGGFSSIFQMNIDSFGYYSKLSYVLSDTFFVLLVAIYFCKTLFKDACSRFLGVACLFIMAPVLVDECCLLMNMGSYLSYSLRFGFLNAAFELYVGCLVLEKVRFNRPAVFSQRDFIETESLSTAGNILHQPLFSNETKVFVSDKENDVSMSAMKPSKNQLLRTKEEVKSTNKPQGQRKTERKRVVAQTGTVLLLIVLSVFACFFIFEAFCIVTGENGLDFGFSPTMSSLFQEIRKAGENFSSSFAHSLGGLEGVTAIFIVVALVVLCAFVIYKFRLLNFKVVFPFVAVVLFMQTSFFGAQLVCGNQYTPVVYRDYEALYEEILQKDEADSYSYRIKDLNSNMSDNQTLITSSYSYSSFSSVIDRTNYAPNIVFGYGTNGINSLRSAGGTLLGDCLLGYKYYFASSVEEATRYDYLVKTVERNTFSMYENTLVFPSAFTVSSSDMGVTTEYNAYFENMQNLYRFLGGTGDVFKTIPIEDDIIDNVSVYDDVSGKNIQTVRVKIYLNDSGDFSFYSNLPTDKGIRYYTQRYSSSRDIGEVKTYTYNRKAAGKQYSMYLYCENENYDLTVEEVKKNCAIKVITKNTVELLSRELRKRACEYSIENTLLKTSYIASVSTEQEGEYLFLNYIALRGMKAYVNGKEVSMVQNGLNFMLVPLEKGENQVRIVYSSPYPVYAAVCLVVAVVLLVGIAIILRKKENWVKVLEVPIAKLSAGIALFVVLLFMAFPTALLVFKLFYNLFALFW